MGDKNADLADVAPNRISRILSEPIEERIFFAGDAYTQENDWGAVHNAVRSARDAVQEFQRTNRVQIFLPKVFK